MVEIKQLHEKWRAWLLGDLLGQFVVLMGNLKIYQAFEVVWGRQDTSVGDEIATWTILNYFESACLAVRRLGDKDKKSRSMRRLLEEMKSHAYAFPKIGRIANDPTIGTKLRTPEEIKNHFVQIIDEDINSMITFTKIINEHADKYLAHIDKDRRRIGTANVQHLEKAILKYHLVFRKWAYLIADHPCDFANFDHFDLSKVDYAKVHGELTKMWSALR